MDLPLLTREIPGIGGSLKVRPEDFFVQELPLYEPSGEGEHVYCEVQKVGMTSFELIRRLAEALRVSARDIGYAGLKDARAVTRQLLSIPAVTEEQVMGLRVPDVQVQWAARHGNKLRLGHLRGNRFAIKVRDVVPTDVVRVRPLARVLEERGMPNYFGVQRFGKRGNNDRLGAALLRGDPEGFLAELLGRPDPAVDAAEEVEARAAFDRGDLPGAMRRMPRHCRVERAVLHRLMKTGRAGVAARAVDERLRRLWISALQSRLFNDVTARRIGALATLMEGDIAMKHENRACFVVEDAAAEQPRCDTFEISPTGPLIGYRMTEPRGEAARIEAAVFADAGLAPAMFRDEGRLRVKGQRRALRVRPEDVQLAAGVDEHGSHITLAFTLPAGSYATVLLREVMKNDVATDAEM